jgi:PAS domain S-box-containing protein
MSYALIPEGKFRRLLLVGVLLPVVLGAIFISVVTAFFVTAGNVRTEAIRQRNTLFEARDARTDLLNMETGLRGFLLFHNDDYRKPYDKSKSKLDSELGKLMEDAESDPTDRSEVRQIEAHARGWLQTAEAQLAMTRLGQRLTPADADLARRQFTMVQSGFDSFLGEQTQSYEDTTKSVMSYQVTLGWIVFAGIVILGTAVASSTTILMRKLSDIYHVALTAIEEQADRARKVAERYKLVTDNSSDLICVLDRNHFYTFVSPSYGRVLGLEPEDVVGKPMIEFVHEEDRARLDEKLRELGDSGTDIVEVKKKTKEGVWRNFEMTLAGVDDKIVAVGRDVTERMEAEQRILELNAQLEHRVAERTEELAHANKELEAFSYSVSHDLRAPLRSIASFSMILQEDLEDKLDEDSADNLSRIRAAAQKMTALIDALLRFSRIARADMTLSDVDMSQLVESITAELKRREPEREVEIVIQPDVIDQADPQLLRVVLENLLENSWKFTSNVEAAKIEFGKEDDHYFLRDNGVGFEQEYVEKVFLPFERLHTDREFPGTGIGLATTKRIIDRHGGKIWAEGNVGKGATFNFTLHA